MLAHAQQSNDAPVSPALKLWREVEPLVIKDEQQARTLLTRDPAAARALYRELLFDAVDARLYDNQPMSPDEAHVRALIATLDAESAALEAKFNEWAQDGEHKAGTGFTAAAQGFEQLLYLYIAAEQKNVERLNEQAQAGTAKVTTRDLTERALALADALHVELAAAACANNLGFVAGNERRRDDMPPLIARAQSIWQLWQHPTGLAGVAFLRGEHATLAENWPAAAAAYRRAAELAGPLLPQLRPFRILALKSLARSLRNANDQAGAITVLTEVVAEQQKLADGTTEQERKDRAVRDLASGQIVLGEALAAAGRHAEAGAWYARADQLREASYQWQRTQIQAALDEWTAKLKAAEDDPKLDAAKRKFEISRANLIIDTYLSLLTTTAKERHDTDTLVKLATRRATVARASGNTDTLADALDGLAQAYLAAGDYKSARATGEEARALRLNDPRRKFLYTTVERLGEVAVAAEDAPKAEARFREVIELAKPGALPAPFDLAIETDESIRQIRARMNANDQLYRLFTALQARLGLAQIEQNRGNYSAADEQFTTIAHDIFKLYAAGAPDEPELTRWLDEQAAQAATQTEAQARNVWSIKLVDIAAHRQQTGLTPDAGELERIHQADLLANSMRATLALKHAQLLHDQGDLVAAADSYRAAIRQITDVLGGSFPLVGAQLALAQIERERGHYEAAEAPIQTALAQSQRDHNAASVAGILAQLSVLRLRAGRLDEAHRAIEDALQIARVVNSRAQLANMLQVLGSIESEQGGATLKTSEQHLRAALGLARELGERERIAYALSDLGLTLEREGREREALVAYEEAVHLVETLTASLSKDVSAEVFSTKRANRELYERLIHLLIKNGRAGDALGYLERAKAKSLVEALAGAEVSAHDPALKELVHRVRATSDAVRVAESALTTATVRPEALSDKAQIKTAQAALTRAQTDYTAAVAALQRANPAYASLVAVRSTDLTQIRQALAPGTLLIEYFPTDTTLYIFYLSRNEAPQVRAVALKHDELARLVNEYRAAVVVPSKSEAFARARGLADEMDTGREVKAAIRSMQELTGQLYDVLFAPVQAEIDRADTLLLVPAAELYYLPLHALGRAQADGSISYLIEQKRFAYLAAADAINTVAGQTSARQPTTTKEALLALGNPDGSLPAAAEEVQTLSRIFPQADIYTGKNATLQRIASMQPTQSVPYIHFATHGVINSREPKESYLLLAGQPGHLSVKDLVEDTYGMSFNGTRLVTLSACQTSIGGWDPSAVYSSLSRAFAKAGAPTVVASLWSVNDTATRDMMTVFYRELAAGQSKAEAMRRAQLAVMHDARFTHPFFWAPFIVLGDWR